MKQYFPPLKIKKTDFDILQPSYEYVAHQQLQPLVINTMTIAEQAVYDTVMQERMKQVQAAENSRLLKLFKMEHNVPQKQDIDLTKFPTGLIYDTPGFEEIIRVKEEF